MGCRYQRLSPHQAIDFVEPKGDGGDNIVIGTAEPDNFNTMVSNSFPLSFCLYEYTFIAS